MADPDERASPRELLAAGALFVLLTAVSFARLWPRFTTHSFASASPYDFGPNLWLQWWGPFALSHGLNPFFTRWMFHPMGMALSVDAWPLMWLLLWPLGALLGPVGAYNALAAFSFVCAGTFAYALFRFFCRSREGCVLGAMAFAFGASRDYRMVVAHSDLLQNQWSVLLFLAWAACLRPGAARRTLLLLVPAVVLAAYNERRTFLIGSLLCAVYGLALAWTSRSKAPRSRSVPAWLWPAAAAALAVLPLAVSDARVLGFWAPAFLPHPDFLRVTLGRVLLPPRHHVLRALGALPPGGEWKEYNEGFLDPFLLALAAAGLSRIGRDPERRALAVSLAVFFLLECARWPLAYAPVLSFLWVPARFASVVALLACLFAALGWDAAAQRLKTRPARLAALAAVCALLFLETNPLWQAPTPILSGGPQPALEALRLQDGAVADLPLPSYERPRRIPPRAFWRGVVHGRPMINGHLSVMHHVALEAFSSSPVLRALLDCQLGRGCEGADARLAALKTIGVRWVICDLRDAAEDPLRAAARRSKALRPLGSGPDYELYELR